MNITLDLDQLNTIRKEGYRPGVVACIIHNKKVVMFYKKDHKLWQLPQGRIANKENVEDSLKRNLLEELGEDFVNHLELEKTSIIDQDSMEFKPGMHEVDTLVDDEGIEQTMLGKKYFFCVIPSKVGIIDLTKTVFDQYFWLSFREAYFLSDKIYQKGKRRITVKVINKLNELGMIE